MKEQLNLKPNRIRQNENLAKLDNAFWHGHFYRQGVAQMSKDQQYTLKHKMRRVPSNKK